MCGSPVHPLHSSFHSETTKIVDVDENVESNLIDFKTRAILENYISTQDMQPSWALETLNHNPGRTVKGRFNMISCIFTTKRFTNMIAGSRWEIISGVVEIHFRPSSIKSDYVILSSINLIAIPFQICCT